MGVAKAAAAGTAGLGGGWENWGNASLFTWLPII